MQVLDSFRVSRGARSQGLNMYWDEIHFLPIVYETHNDILLSQMCPGEGQLTRPTAVTIQEMVATFDVRPPH